MRDARMMAPVCLGGCLAFVAALLTCGPLGEGRPRTCDLLPDPDGPPAEWQATYDLAALPRAEAERLRGGRELYRVRLDGAPAEVNGRLGYEVAVRDPDALDTA
jgi:hypothetical protein